MKRDFFTNLPQEITIKILSKLPFETLMISKCVQKSWLSLTETTEFIISYFSQESFSAGLAFFQHGRHKPLNILEFVDNLDPQASANPCKLAMKFSFSFSCPAQYHLLSVHSSVNGLLLMVGLTKFPHDIYICNPITREYVKLPPPPPPPPVEASSSKLGCPRDSIGFGVSRVSGQYKVVRVFREFYYNGVPSPNLWRQSPCKCEVFTIETGSWRSVAGPPTAYAWEYSSVFLNGSVHWLVIDLESLRWILRFNLETEAFATFSIPLHELSHNVLVNGSDNVCLCALEGRLCLSDNSAFEIAIWLMNEYGDEQSWRKDIVIKKSVFSDKSYFPIKVYKDGDVLMVRELSHELVLYSSKNGDMERIDLIESFAYTCSRVVVYTPSFLPLKTYTKENCSLVIEPTETEWTRFMSKVYSPELVKGVGDLKNALQRYIERCRTRCRTKLESDEDE